MTRKLTRGDLLLIKQAMVERWPIPPEKRREILEQIDAVLTDPESSPREILAAVRSYLAADRINLEDAKLANDAANQSIDVRIALAESRAESGRDETKTNPQPD